MLLLTDRLPGLQIITVNCKSGISLSVANRLVKVFDRTGRVLATLFAWNAIRSRNCSLLIGTALREDVVPTDVLE